MPTQDTIYLALLISTSSQENCDDMKCSNVIDYVCGAIEYRNGSVMIMKYQNICIMRQSSCKLKPIAEIYKASDILCNISKPADDSGRRVTDFSIVGAHQVCNHTCPTYCVDTYQPVCAVISRPDDSGSVRKPMVNHCHTDLYSCSTGLNVTITALSNCYANSAALLFIKHVAAMKSLKLLDDSIAEATNDNIKNSGHKRRSNYENLNRQTKFKSIKQYFLYLKNILIDALNKKN